MNNPPAHMQRLTGDKLRGVGREETHGVRDILRRSPPVDQERDAQPTLGSSSRISIGFDLSSAKSLFVGPGQMAFAVT